MSSRIIAIDFDGTIVKDQFPEIGEMVDKAKENILKLKKDGYTIIIWTCRSGVEFAKAVQWLAENGIKYDQINESCPKNVAKYDGRDTRKVYADIYIDDKGLLYPLPHWDEIYEMIIDRVPLTREDKAIRDGFL